MYSEKLCDFTLLLLSSFEDDLLKIVCHQVIIKSTWMLATDHYKELIMPFNLILWAPLLIFQVWGSFFAAQTTSLRQIQNLPCIFSDFKSKLSYSKLKTFNFWQLFLDPFVTQAKYHSTFEHNSTCFYFSSEKSYKVWTLFSLLFTKSNEFPLTMRSGLKTLLTHRTLKPLKPSPSANYNLKDG